MQGEIVSAGGWGRGARLAPEVASGIFGPSFDAHVGPPIPPPPPPRGRAPGHTSAWAGLCGVHLPQRIEQTSRTGPRVRLAPSSTGPSPCPPRSEGNPQGTGAMVHMGRTMARSATGEPPASNTRANYVDHVPIDILDDPRVREVSEKCPTPVRPRTLCRTHPRPSLHDGPPQVRAQAGQRLVVDRLGP